MKISTSRHYPLPIMTSRYKQRLRSKCGRRKRKQKQKRRRKIKRRLKMLGTRMIMTASWTMMMIRMMTFTRFWRRNQTMNKYRHHRHRKHSIKPSLYKSSLKRTWARRMRMEVRERPRGNKLKVREENKSWSNNARRSIQYTSWRIGSPRRRQHWQWKLFKWTKSPHKDKEMMVIRVSWRVGNTATIKSKWPIKMWVE